MLHQLIYYITETTSQPLPETIFLSVPTGYIVFIPFTEITCIAQRSQV